MTTVSEFLEGQFGPSPTSFGGSEGAGTGAPVRARVAATDGDAKWSRILSWLRAGSATVVADLRGAWWWRGTPPTLAHLWAGRTPARDRVPGSNAALWVGWAVYNHLYLAVAGPLYVLFFALAHPARFVLAAAVAVSLFFVWA